MTTAHQPFGPRLRAARTRAGLTQAALAERIGYTPNTVARWERGERVPHPSVQDRALRLGGVRAP